MTNQILAMKEKRFQFLKRMFEITEGNEKADVNLWELGDELGYSRPETDKIDDYLVGEELIFHFAFVGVI